MTLTYRWFKIYWKYWNFQNSFHFFTIDALISSCSECLCSAYIYKYSATITVFMSKISAIRIAHEVFLDIQSFVFLNFFLTLKSMKQYNHINGCHLFQIQKILETTILLCLSEFASFLRRMKKYIDDRHMKKVTKMYTCIFTVVVKLEFVWNIDIGQMFPTSNTNEYQTD